MVVSAMPVRPGIAGIIEEDDRILERLSRTECLPSADGVDPSARDVRHDVVDGDLLQALVARLHHETGQADNLACRLKHFMVRKLCSSRLHWCLRMWNRAAARSSYVGAVQVRCARKRQMSLLWRSVGVWMRLWEQNKRFVLLVALTQSRRITAILRSCLGCWDEWVFRNQGPAVAGGKVSADEQQPSFANAPALTAAGDFDVHPLASGLAGARSGLAMTHEGHEGPSHQDRTPSSVPAVQTNPFAFAVEEHDGVHAAELTRALGEAREQVQELRTANEVLQKQLELANAEIEELYAEQQKRGEESNSLSYSRLALEASLVQTHQALEQAEQARLNVQMQLTACQEQVRDGERRLADLQSEHSSDLQVRCRVKHSENPRENMY